MQELLTQINQRVVKLQEELDKLHNLEFDYHTLCSISDYSIVQDQKDYVEFCKGKLITSLKLLETL